MPKKLESCVSQVLKDNPDLEESNAYAICTAALDRFDEIEKPAAEKYLGRAVGAALANKPFILRQGQRGVIYAPFTRLDEDQHEAWGAMLQEDVDTYDTVFEYEGARAAVAEWTGAFQRSTGGLSFGNVREMHQKWAIGKVIAWDANDKARRIDIGTKIVDEDAWPKFKERVYTGWSIGFDDAVVERRKFKGKTRDVIVSFRVVEVSAVDIPSVPGTNFTLVRRAKDGSTTWREVAGARAADPPAPLDPMQAAIAAIRKDHEGAEGPKALNPQEVIDAVSAEAVARAKAGAGAVAPPARVSAGGDGAARAQGTEGVTERVFALMFGPSFTAASAAEWCRTHGFRDKVRKVQGVVGSPDNTVPSLLATQRAESLFAGKDGRCLRVAEGVQAIVRPLAESPVRTRVLDTLQTAKPGLRRYLDEGSSILPALAALMDICQAISSECFEILQGEDEAEERKDIATLVAAADGILEYVQGEFQEILANETNTPGGVIYRAARTEAQRIADLGRVLTIAQKVRMSDDDLRANMSAMHEIGHDLSDGTLAMGADCTRGCRDAGDDDGDGKDDNDEGDDGHDDGDHGSEDHQDDGQDHGDDGNDQPPPKKGKGKGKGRAVAPAAPDAEDKVLKAVLELTGKVASLEATTGEVRGALDRVRRTPAPLGRPPAAAPVDKTVGGPQDPSGETDQERASKYARLAEGERDPKVREQLIMRAASLSIQSIQSGRP